MTKIKYREVATMVTVNQPTITTDARRNAGLLGEQVKQDLADVLNEYGANPAATANEREAAPRLTFGYGIPMAGVRYYTFAPAE